MLGSKDPQFTGILNNVFLWAYGYIIRNAVYEFTEEEITVNTRPEVFNIVTIGETYHWKIFSSM